MRFFIKAKATKYIKRWKGKDGKWNYKYPSKGKPSTTKEAKPERKMIVKDESGKAPLMSPDGEVYVTSNMSATSQKAIEAGSSTRFKIPEKHVKEIFEWGGMKFAVHRKTDKSTNTLGSVYAVSELTSGAVASRSVDEMEGEATLKSATIKVFEEMGVDKVKGSVDSFIKDRGGVIWELKNASNFDDPIVDIHDPEVITGVAKEIINQLDVLEEEDDLENVETWVKDYLEDSLIANPVPIVRGDYSDEVLEIAIMGIGDEMEPMDLSDAQETLNFLEEVQNELHEEGQEGELYAIASWAQKVGIDMSSMGDNISEWEYADPSGAAESSIGNTIFAAMESETTPEAIIEMYEEEAEEQAEKDDDPLEGDVDIAGATWDNDSLKVLGSWVGGGGSVRSVRGSIVQKDLEGFPAEFKQKLGYEYFEQYRTEYAEEEAESIMDRVVGIDDDVLYRTTKNEHWTNLEVGEALPLGIASFSRGVETQFGHIKLELVIPPPLRGISVDDINIQNRPIAEHYGINSHDKEREVIVRAPFLQVIERTTPTLVKVRVIDDPQEVLTSMSQGEAMKKAQDDRLFSDDDKVINPPIIIRDDPKMYASLHADLSRPLSDRGKGKKLIIKVKK